MVRILLVLLLVFGAALVAAIRYLPWWGVIAVFAGLFVVIKFLGGRLLKGLFMGPFKAKSRVLKNAEVEVHSVQPATPPTVSGEDFEHLGPEDIAETEAEWARLRWFEVEASFKLDPSQAREFRLWDPYELMLVPMTAKPEPDESEDEFSVHNLWTYRDGTYVEEEDDKIEGDRRLKMRFGVPQGQSELQFRYYFELFGKVQLPG